MIVNVNRFPADASGKDWYQGDDDKDTKMVVMVQQQQQLQIQMRQAAMSVRH